MAGFPARTSHQALGGNREDAMRVTNPKQQIAYTVWNAVQWQVAGMNRTASLVTLTVDAAGQRTSGAEAWNDLDAVPLRVTITHDTPGQYQIQAAATYPDENGDERAVEFHGAVITPIAAVPIVASFTLDSPTLVTVYLFDPLDSYNPVDVAFTVDIK